MKTLALAFLVVVCAGCAQTIMATPETDFLATERARCEQQGKNFYSGYHRATNGYMAACIAK